MSFVITPRTLCTGQVITEAIGERQGTVADKTAFTQRSHHKSHILSIAHVAQEHYYFYSLSPTAHTWTFQIAWVRPMQVPMMSNYTQGTSFEPQWVCTVLISLATTNNNFYAHMITI